MNDSPETMTRLVKRLGHVNVHPYYVYVHDLVRGVEDLRTSVDTALHIEKHVRGSTAGFNTPTFVVDAPGGGGKRDAHSYEYYDRETGISVYTAPSVKPGQHFMCFDPAPAQHRRPAPLGRPGGARGDDADGPGQGARARSLTGLTEVAALPYPANMRRLLCVALLGAVFGCKEQPITPFKVIVHVDSDPGFPLANQPIMFNDTEIKKTDVKGDAVIETRRPDGEVVTLTVKCPLRLGAAEPVRVTVRRTEGQALTKFDRACRPLMRSIAVVVRADNGPNSPVMYLNNEVARTDASRCGPLRRPPPRQRAIHHHPEHEGRREAPSPNPSVPLIVGESDEVKLINIKFERERRPRLACPFVREATSRGRFPETPVALRATNRGRTMEKNSHDTQGKPRVPPRVCCF